MGRYDDVSPNARVQADPGPLLDDIAFGDDEPSTPPASPPAVSSPPPASVQTAGVPASPFGPLLPRPGSVRDGATFILSLEEVRAQLGERWPQMRERLYNAIESAVHELVDPSDALVRVGSHRFLLAFKHGGEVNTHARAAIIAKKVKDKLFGTSSSLSIKVYPYGATAIAHGSAAPETASRGGFGPYKQETRAGQFAFAPIWDSVHKVLSTYYAVPFQINRLGKAVMGRDLLPRDATEMMCAAFDVQGLEHVIYVADELYRSKFAVFITAFIDYHSLETAKSRQVILSACQRIPDSLRKYIICEIARAPATAPTTTLGDRVAQLKPYFRNVILEINSLDEPLSRLGYLGLHGVYYHHWRQSDPHGQSLGAVRRAVQDARAAHLQLGIGGVSSKAQAHNFASLGVTYLSGPFIGDVLEMPANMQRCTLDDLGRNEIN